MPYDRALIFWQGGMALAVLLAWVILAGLWPVRRRLGDSAAPVNGVVLVLCVAGFVSGAVGFGVVNWPFYAVMALGLNMALSMLAAPLLLWRFPVLTRESWRGLMMPWALTILSLVVFGLLRLTLWLILDIWSVVVSVVMGILDAF